MQKIIIDMPDNIFNLAKDNIQFESITKGRQGANLVDNLNVIPLVRTTTKYNNQSQLFNDTHFSIMNKIKEDYNIELNNALIEIYDNSYKKMGFHSDQALDLKEDSYICIFSCYNNKNPNLRKLIIKDKESNEMDEIIMDHNSIIMFSTNTNKRYLHKIVLCDGKEVDDNLWLGITFRLSKTFIEFKNDIPYFYNTNRILKIANEEETKEYYKLRSLENKSINFEYPELNYTISYGDI